VAVGRSANAADSHCLEAQHLLQAGVHLVFFDEFAAVGLVHMHEKAHQKNEEALWRNEALLEKSQVLIV